MIETSEAIRTARALIGTPYSELDCINLIKKVIRTCAGGDKRYTTAGTNALWDSYDKTGKYRDLIWRQTGISDAKPGMLAFMGVGTGDVSHTGLVTERETVIHSSKSWGCVVETELTEKRGWNGLGKHRMIAVDGEETADSAEGESVTVCAQGGLRMRKKPDVRGEYMQMLPDGAVIVALETRAGWIKT
ncbi:MAG: hypothetical protein ACLS7Z_08035, partial [Christensenellales bacterium]